MKKLLTLIYLLPPSCLLNAQNVGVGTTTPAEKLEIKNPLRSTVKISSNSFADTTQLLLSNRNSSNLGTDFSLKHIREEGLFFSSQSDFPANTANNTLVLTPGGNVGVGTVPASANKFQVSGTTSLNGLTKVEGLNLFEFGAGVAGKEVNAGKIGYNAFGQSALTFVGGGTNSTNRKVYFFAEGGVEMNGPLNISGPLKVNGSSGTEGQVLTSNGTAEPTWSNSSFTNTTRFAVNFNIPGFSTPSGNVTFLTPVKYNLDPAAISIGTTSITLTKAGLYRFYLWVDGQVGYSSVPLKVPSITAEIRVQGQPYTVLNKGFPMLNNGTGTLDSQFYFGELVSLDVYVAAGNTVRVYTSIGDPSPGINSGYFTGGYLSGYLISE